MKKTFYFISFSLIALAVWAQPSEHIRQNGHRINKIEQLAAKNSYQYKLVEFHTNDMYQFCGYSYNVQYQLVAVRDSVSGDYSLIDSLFYNNQGQMTRLSGWQLLDGRWENVYYIDYTYDPAGNIATRTNYNNFDGDWQIGGVYEYTYNSDNQIVLSVLTMSGIQFQKVEYAYTDGRLDLEMWYSYDGSGLSPDEKLGYTYNANGKLMRIDDSVSDGYGGWVYYARHNYMYDNAGNCTEHHYYDNTGMEAERSIYQFDYDMMLDETLMPWTPEMTRPETYTNVNAYSVEQWYSVDVDHHLQYVCDYHYNYADINAGVSEVAGNVLATSPNPASGIVYIEGLPEEPVQVQLVDMKGSVVHTDIVSSVSNMINVESLPTGCYVLRVVCKGMLTTAKLVVE